MVLPAETQLSDAEAVMQAFVGRGVKDRALWLKARKTGIGGSDAAAAVGLSPWKTPLKLYLEKRDETPDEDLSENKYVEWGIRLEDVVAQAYADRKGVKVRRKNAILRHHKYPWMICNLDREIVGSDAALECKTADAHTADKWGPDGSDEIPVPYFIQVQHDICVAELEWMDLAALIGGNDFRIYPIKRDQRLIDRLITLEGEFWERVQNGEPPPPQTVDDARALYPDAREYKKQADDIVAEKCKSYRQLKASAKDVDAMAESLKVAIMQFMGEADTLMHNGKRIATWKTQERKAYSVPASSTRVLRVDEPKSEETKK